MYKYDYSNNIYTLFKDINNNNYKISSEVIKQLNLFVNLFLSKLISICLNLNYSTKRGVKKKLTDTCIFNSINILLHPNISKNLLTSIDKRNIKYFKIKKVKLLVCHYFSGLKSKIGIEYLVLSVEYILTYMFKEIFKFMKENDKALINNHVVMEALSCDYDFIELIRDLEWSWFNSGVVRFIHTNSFGSIVHIYFKSLYIDRLSLKSGDKPLHISCYKAIDNLVLKYISGIIRTSIIYAKYNKRNTVKRNDIYMASRIKGYVKFGAKKRKIKRLSKSISKSKVIDLQDRTSFIIPKIHIRRIVLGIAHKYDNKIRISSSVIIYMHNLIEDYICKLIRSANLINNKPYIESSDIYMCAIVRGDTLKYEV